MIVEWTVVGVLDPFVQLLLCLVRDIKAFEKKRTERDIRNLIIGANVVDLTNLALVENGVESIGSISSKEVATGRTSIAVENNRLSTIQ